MWDITVSGCQLNNTLWVKAHSTPFRLSPPVTAGFLYTYAASSNTNSYRRVWLKTKNTATTSTTHTPKTVPLRSGLPECSCDLATAMLFGQFSPGVMADSIFFPVLTANGFSPGCLQAGYGLSWNGALVSKRLSWLWMISARFFLFCTVLRSNARWAVATAS